MLKNYNSNKKFLSVHILSTMYIVYSRKNQTRYSTKIPYHGFGALDSNFFLIKNNSSINYFIDLHRSEVLAISLSQYCLYKVTNFNAGFRCCSFSYFPYFLIL